MKTRDISLATAVGITILGLSCSLAAEDEPVKKVAEPTLPPAVVSVWKTTSRITETNDSGLAAIPEGVEVKVVDKDGKSFISYGRTLISMETAKDSIVSVGKNVQGTAASPMAEGGIGSPSPSLSASGNDGVLSDEEREILSKGKPAYNLRELLQPLDSAKITQHAGFRFRYQQITQEKSEINKSLNKGRIVGNAKTKLADLELQKAQLELEQSRASLAYNQAYSAIKAKLEKEQIAYSNALAKQKRIEEAKMPREADKPEESK